MKNIITQNGCWNCIHQIDESNLRSWTEWPASYCDYDKSCPATYKDWELTNEDGSDIAIYDEQFNTLNNDIIIDRLDKMLQWRRHYSVLSQQICDNYQKKKEIIK